MNKKLWQTNSEIHQLVEVYTVGDDHVIDLQLLPYDVTASIAHAEMLTKIGILKQNELVQVKKGLQEIMKKWGSGEFTINRDQEDGHTAIEQYLTEEFGDTGKKIHAGRSRNDQSLVMMRLFMKEKLLEIEHEVETLIVAFQKRSDENQDIEMPGYTHMQKAMPTTVGMWLNSYAGALEDSRKCLRSTHEIIDQNPLGSASGFGVENLSLDRKMTTDKLGFKKTQENPLYCGLSRGYFETIVLQALSQPMILASKFAQDMLIFTTQEFNFFSLPNEFTTGSSIMPQKRNYDVFEVMRGNVKVLNSYQNEIAAIVSSIGSGYQRDLQLTKKPFVLGVNIVLETIVLLSEIISSIQVHQDILKKSMTSDLYATREVYELVRSGWSFRDAYIEVKKAYKK